MLVVRGRKETDPPPPVYGAQGLGAPDQEAVEGHMEGPRVETPQGPLGQAVMEGKVHGAVLVFLRSTRVGWISARRTPLEELDGAGWGNEGEEGGQGPPV